MLQFQQENYVKTEKYEKLQENFRDLKIQYAKKITQFEIEKKSDMQSIIFLIK